MAVKLSKTEIVDRLSNMFPHIKVDVDTLKNSVTPANFTCEKHNTTFTIKPYSVFVSKSGGCPECKHECYIQNNVKSKDELIPFFNKLFNNKYDYSLLTSVKTFDTLSVICPIHGEFEILSKNHKRGLGCPQCSLRQGWSTSDWVKFCNLKQRKLTFYIIELFNEQEHFVKCGITSQTVAQRMAKIPYNYNLVGSITGDADVLALLDKTILRYLKQFSYKPKIEFGGKTECLSIDVLDYINSFITIIDNNQEIFKELFGNTINTLIDNVNITNKGFNIKFKEN